MIFPIKLPPMDGLSLKTCLEHWGLHVLVHMSSGKHGFAFTDILTIFVNEQSVLNESGHLYPA